MKFYSNSCEKITLPWPVKFQHDTGVIPRGAQYPPAPGLLRAIYGIRRILCEPARTHTGSQSGDAR
jgi:hypothetical protein